MLFKVFAAIFLFYRSLWFRSAVVIGRKEFLQLSRNKMFWRGVVVTQVLQLGMLGFLDTTTRNLPLVIVDQCHTTESRELTAKLARTSIFEVRYVTHSVNDARELIRGGHAKAGVIIPPDFHNKRAAKSSAQVLALVDGSDSAASSQALSTISGLVREMASAEKRLTGKGEDPSIDAHTITLFNPEGRTANFMLPALLVMMLGAMMMVATHAIVRERESGTLERLLMTPLSYTGLMLGKVTPVFIIGLIDAAVVLSAMRWIFQVPIRGNLLLIFGSIGLYLLTLAAMGVYLGCTAANGLEAGQKSTYLTLPNMFLSGYIFPLTGIPKFLLPIAYMLPATHMVEIMRASVLRDARLSDMLPHVLYLTFVPAIMIFLAVRQFRAAIGKT